MKPYVNNVRMFACADGDTGREQLLFNCSRELQKRFDGKRVEIKILEEKPKASSRRGKKP